jgi:hypothetical protein
MILVVRLGQLTEMASFIYFNVLYNPLISRQVDLLRFLTLICMWCSIQGNRKMINNHKKFWQLLFQMPRHPSGTCIVIVHLSSLGSICGNIYMSLWHVISLVRSGLLTVTHATDMTEWVVHVWCRHATAKQNNSPLDINCERFCWQNPGLP